METPSRVASVSVALGLAGLALFAAGPTLIQLDLVGPEFGFRVFGLGFLGGLLALVLGAIGLLRTRPGSGRSGRPKAVGGSLLGLAIAGVALASSGGAMGLPPINDITTNPDDPPVFRHAQTLAGNENADFAYPGDDFAEAQRAAYPDLQSVSLSAPPAEAFRRVEAAAGTLGWEVTYRDAGVGVLEATETSRIFRFVDDVTVRIQPAGNGSLIDVRSRSRVGRGDLGANAARIRALRDALR